MALPYAYWARMPVSFRARIAASGCSGVLLMWDQSTSVVMPALRHSRAPREVGRVDVLGGVEGGEGVQDVDEVVVEGGVRRHVADRGLPGVAVGVDEAGNHDATGHVEDFGVRADLAVHRGDPAVLDEDVPPRQVPDAGVHGEHVSGAKECPMGHRASSSGVFSTRRGS
ncbi:hypothetical protein RKD19_001314 [Streptomyces canus]